MSARSGWNLRLYVAGMTSTAQRARDNLHEICEQHLDADYTIDIIDLVEQPGLAEADQIIAVPTVVKNVPLPVRRVVGDLSKTEHVLVGLDIPRKP